MNKQKEKNTCFPDFPRWTKKPDILPPDIFESFTLSPTLLEVVFAVKQVALQIDTSSGDILSWLEYALVTILDN